MPNLCAQRLNFDPSTVLCTTRVWISSLFVLLCFFGLDLMVVDINWSVHLDPDKHLSHKSRQPSIWKKSSSCASHCHVPLDDVWLLFFLTWAAHALHIHNRPGNRKLSRAKIDLTMRFFFLLRLCCFDQNFIRFCFYFFAQDGWLIRCARANLGCRGRGICCKSNIANFQWSVRRRCCVAPFNKL